MSGDTTREDTQNYFEAANGNSFLSYHNFNQGACVEIRVSFSLDALEDGRSRCELKMSFFSETPINSPFTLAIKTDPSENLDLIELNISVADMPDTDTVCFFFYKFDTAYPGRVCWLFSFRQTHSTQTVGAF